MRQELAVLMLKRQNKDTTLPANFWNLPKFKKAYQHQLRLATKLLKTYSEQAIQNVLQREDWIYSLAIKRLDDLLLVEETKISKEQFEYKPNTNNVPPNTFIKQKTESFKK